MIEFIAMKGMPIWARASVPRGANRANSPARAGAQHLSAELSVAVTNRANSPARAGAQL